MSQRLWKVLKFETNASEKQQSQHEKYRQINQKTLDMKNIGKKQIKNSGQTSLINSSNSSSHFVFQKEKYPFKAEYSRRENTSMTDSKFKQGRSARKSFVLNVFTKIKKDIQNVRRISKQINHDLQNQKLFFNTLSIRLFSAYEEKVQLFLLKINNKIGLYKKESLGYQQKMKVIKQMFDSLNAEAKKKEIIWQTRQKQMLIDLEVKNKKIQTLEEEILIKNNKIERLLQTVDQNELQMTKCEKQMSKFKQENQRKLFDLENLHATLETEMRERQNEIKVYFQIKAKEEYGEKICKLEEQIKYASIQSYEIEQKEQELSHRQELVNIREQRAHQFMLQLHENAEQLIQQQVILKNKNDELIRIQQELYNEIQKGKCTQKAHQTGQSLYRNPVARTRVKTCTNQAQMGNSYPNFYKKSHQNLLTSIQSQKITNNQSLVRSPYAQNKQMKLKQFHRGQKTYYSPHYSPNNSLHYSSPNHSNQTSHMLTKNRMKKENFNTTDLKKQLNKSLMNKLDSLRIELRTEIKNNTSQ